MQATHPSSSHHGQPSQWFGLAGWLALTFAAAAAGSIASINAGEFYTSLQRPAWAPPAAVFGPVWTALYLMMAVAAWLVWRDAGWRGARTALGVYVAQLVLNTLWSWLFFAWQRGAAAFAEVLLLWAAIALTLVLFLRVRRAAGLLLVPYLAWVSYAAALTFAVWQRNPAQLG